MAKSRFEEVYTQGVANVRKILVDTETGVNYLLASSSTTLAIRQRRGQQPRDAKRL